MYGEGFKGLAELAVVGLAAIAILVFVVAPVTLWWLWSHVSIAIH